MADPTCHCGVEKSKHAHEDHTFVELPEPEPPNYACMDCGYTGNFMLLSHIQGDYDLECPECESTHVEEVPLALRKLVEQLDTAQADETLQDALNDLERALEHWPRLKPLYGEEQTEATSALTEIGLCIGEAKQRLLSLL